MSLEGMCDTFRLTSTLCPDGTGRHPDGEKNGQEVGHALTPDEDAILHALNLLCNRQGRGFRLLTTGIRRNKRPFPSLLVSSSIRLVGVDSMC